MADEEDVLDSSESGNEQASESIGLSVDDSRSCRKAKKIAWLSDNLIKRENRARSKRVSNILKKSEERRTQEEVEFLNQCPDVVEKLNKSALKRNVYKQRTLEVHDPEEELDEKCRQLANAIKTSSNLVVYTGAGISTAASIPDYRGPNGVWTLLQKGQFPEAQDLSDAEPTFTHMCLPVLYSEGHLMHVVSQNCDGLHLRSGIPRKILSEVHGNMFLEICTHCKPHQEYFRLFDVTEKTGVRKHQTDRKCHHCKKPLRDTIVHFGEKGGIKSPYCWKEAAKAAENCDVILCLGTSLKVLKVYSCLWCMDRKPNKRPNLYIVNLQWTPKDDAAMLKINGNCDNVMKRVMQYLGYNVPLYAREYDPIFTLYVGLKYHEKKTTRKKILLVPEFVTKKTIRRKNKGGKGDIKVESSECVKLEKNCSENSSDVDVVGVGLRDKRSESGQHGGDFKMKQETDLLVNHISRSMEQPQNHQTLSVSTAAATTLPVDGQSPRKHDIAQIIPNVVSPPPMADMTGGNGYHPINPSSLISSSTFPPCPKCKMTVRLAGLCACFKGVPFIQVPHFSQGTSNLSSLNTGVLQTAMCRNNSMLPMTFGPLPQFQNVTFPTQLPPLPLIGLNGSLNLHSGLQVSPNAIPVFPFQNTGISTTTTGDNQYASLFSHGIFTSGNETFIPPSSSWVLMTSNMTADPSWQSPISSLSSLPSSSVSSSSSMRNCVPMKTENNFSGTSQANSVLFTSSNDAINSTECSVSKSICTVGSSDHGQFSSLSDSNVGKPETLCTSSHNTQIAHHNTQEPKLCSQMSEAHANKVCNSYQTRDKTNRRSVASAKKDGSLYKQTSVPNEKSSEQFAQPEKITSGMKRKEELKRPRSYSSLRDVAGADVDNTDSDGANKAKLARSMSVPGWYGKGLNLKKRKK